MLNYLQALVASRKSEKGASAVEYGLLVALIAAVIVAAVIIFGDFISDIFTDTCTAIDNGAAAGGGGATADCANAPAGG